MRSPCSPVSDTIICPGPQHPINESTISEPMFDWDCLDTLDKGGAQFGLPGAQLEIPCPCDGCSTSDDFIVPADGSTVPIQLESSLPGLYPEQRVQITDTQNTERPIEMMVTSVSTPRMFTGRTSSRPPGIAVGQKVKHPAFVRRMPPPLLGGGPAVLASSTIGWGYITDVGALPTGVPTAYAGYAPLALDGTTRKLYAFSDTGGGGAWGEIGGSSSTGRQYLRTLAIPAGGAYTSSFDANFAIFRLQGAGGGGGGAASSGSNAAAGGGGGSGGSLIYAIAITPSASYATSVGFGGAGGVNTGGNGGNGGDCEVIIGGTTITATGGIGGTGDTGGTTAKINQGGATGSGTDENGTPFFGNPGLAGIRLSGSVGITGQGGASLFYGNTTPGQTGFGGGSVGNIGSGGEGGLVLSGSSAVTGGEGGDALLVVDEYS